jgi:hypothetical protein
MITVLPENGLCNRMLAIASGRALAAEVNQEMQIIWNEDRCLGASFKDLFCPILGVRVKDIRWNESLLDRLQYPYLCFTERPLLDKLSKFMRSLVYDRVVRSQELHKSLLSGQYGAALLFGSQRTLLLAYEAFHSGAETFLRSFQPLPSLMEIVDRETRCFSHNIVGVHIRRTDHHGAISMSPIDEFERRLAKEIEADRSVMFFLATDCPDTETKIKNRFGERVIIRERCRRRDTVPGMQDALVDLYLLSRTKKILGSCGSTFSGTAGMLGGIPLVTVVET